MILPWEYFQPEEVCPKDLYLGSYRKILHESNLGPWEHKKPANLHHEPNEQALQVQYSFHSSQDHPTLPAS